MSANIYTYFILYKTTNLINGKYYIGIHSTNNLNDSYLGSGTALKDAIKKYGRENFDRLILSIFSSSEEMAKMESLFVTEDLIKDPMSYNMKLGGIYGCLHSEETKKKLSVIGKGKSRSQETREKMSKSRKNSKNIITPKNKQWHHDPFTKLSYMLFHTDEKINQLNLLVGRGEKLIRNKPSALKGKKQTPENVKKRLDAIKNRNNCKGMHWYYNPLNKKNYMLHKDDTKIKDLNLIKGRLF